MASCVKGYTAHLQIKTNKMAQSFYSVLTIWYLNFYEIWGYSGLFIVLKANFATISSSCFSLFYL